METLKVHFKETYGTLKHNVRLTLGPKKYTREVVISSGNKEVTSLNTFAITDLKDLVEGDGGTLTPTFLKVFEGILRDFSVHHDERCEILITYQPTGKQDGPDYQNIYENAVASQEALSKYTSNIKHTLKEYVAYEKMMLHPSDDMEQLFILSCSKLPSIEINPDTVWYAEIACFNMGAKKSRKLEMTLHNISGTDIFLLKLPIPGNGEVVKRVFTRTQVTPGDLVYFISKTLNKNMSHVDHYINFEKHNVKSVELSKHFDTFLQVIKDVYHQSEINKLETLSLKIK